MWLNAEDTAKKLDIHYAMLLYYLKRIPFNGARKTGKGWEFDSSRIEDLGTLINNHRAMKALRYRDAAKKRMSDPIHRKKAGANKKVTCLKPDKRVAERLMAAGFTDAANALLEGRI